MTRGRLTDEQIAHLSEPLDPKRVKVTQGNSHLEGWDVRAHLTRIFGFDGWDEEILSLDLVAEHQGNPLDESKKKWYATYRCTMRLTIWGVDDDGKRAVAKISEEGAVGGSNNLPSHADAHDFAMKEAMTQALKRCAINLGNQFGLSLYDDGSVQSVAEPIPTAPEGSLLMADAATRVKERLTAQWPNASEDWIKATGNAIWKDAGSKDRLVQIGRAKYLPATEVAVLDEVCADTIRTLLEEAKSA